MATVEKIAEKQPKKTPLCPSDVLFIKSKNQCAKMGPPGGVRQVAFLFLVK
jgi:hypothetical protein